MVQLDAVHRAVSFIDDHLRAPITVADVAEAVGYSLFHFSRVFNRIVQHTPFDYLIRRRVSEAAGALLSSEQLIIDIAYDYQFANPETFTRAFRRMFGVTPSDARASPTCLCRNPMPPLSMADLAYRSSTSLTRPSSIVEPPYHLTALQTAVCGDEYSLDAVWEMLIRLLAAQGQEAHRYYAIIWDKPEGGGTHGLAAVCGATRKPVEEEKVPLAPLVTLRLPERTAVRSAYQGPASALSCSLTYLIHTWLPKARLWPADRCVVLDYGESPGGGDTPPVAFSLGADTQPEVNRRHV